MQRYKADLRERFSNHPALVNAENWINAMFDAARATGAGWCNPLVTDSEDGLIVFEWWSDTRKLTVRRGAENKVVKRENVNGVKHRSEEITLDSTDDRKHEWLWLRGYLVTKPPWWSGSIY